MKGRELLNLGVPRGECVKLAQTLAKLAAASGLKKKQIRGHVKDVLADPARHIEHPYFAELAMALMTPETLEFAERAEPAPWKQWGEDLEPQAIEQMQNACRLPVAVAGALMPDAHLGYGLPIGGVLATENAIIPYAVGVDIACRMKLTVLDMPVSALKGQRERLIKTLEEETRFGIGARFRKPHDHAVMEQDWNITANVRNLKEKARTQLGTSGSGNHFVEFGVVTLTQDDLGLKAGKYLALMSHSGSRGAGATIASHYSRLARDLHPELPKELKHLAWLDMDSEAGQEYWAAMNLMGDYAAANHDVIHREVSKALGTRILADVENHHNFCIAEKSIVPTTSGPKYMENLKVGDEIYSFDEQSGICSTKVLDFWCSGEKEVFKIKTRNREIRCSAEHPILVVRVEMKPHPTHPWMKKRVGQLQWVKAEEIEGGDILVCAEGYYEGNDSPLNFTEEEARLCGAFLGDGWIRHSQPEVSGYSVGLAIGEPTQNHTRRYLDLCEKWFAEAKWKMGAKGAFGISCSSKKIHTVVRERFKALRSRERFVPAEMFTSSREAKLHFLAGYVDADGYVCANKKNSGRSTFCSVNRVLMEGFREIALSCGLTATTIREEVVTTNWATTTTYRFMLSADSTSLLPLWHEKKKAHQRKTQYQKPQGLQVSKLGYLSLPEGSFGQKVLSIESEGTKRVFDITVESENHSFVCEGVVVHNCWKEIHDGRELYVHRKGATPAGEGVLGVIPGSMASPAFVVRGRGNEESLRSASHGAGRVMSRKKAKSNFTWSEVKKELRAKDVTLLSAGLDEVPGVYKDINDVMRAQNDLVDIVARFEPKIVKMAPAGERPED